MTHSPAATHPHPRLVLVDGSGYIFRAYHAFSRANLTRADGTPVGAVYGFTAMLLQLRERFAEDAIAVIFDVSRVSFRHAIYPEYKANRAETPEDLIPQFPLVREAARALALPAIELADYEADDLIASYAEAARAQGREVLIVSSDKDLMQLITDGVAMWDPMKEKPIGAAEVLEKFGVTPDKVVEVQSLIGDSSDNVPGVPSIGPKTAAELITRFGDLEGVLANLEEIPQPKRRAALAEHAEAARMSHRLVTLKRDVPLPEKLEDLQIRPIDRAVLEPFLREQGFGSLLRKLGASAAAQPKPLPSGEVDAATASGEGISIRPSIPTHYETLRTEADLARWIAEARLQGVVAVDTETTGLDAMQAELVGISLATAAGKACYIPLGHIAGEAVPTQGGLFDAPVAAPRLAEGQLPREVVLTLLAPLFADVGVLKIGHNIKYDLVVLSKYGTHIAPLGDTMLMSYALGGGLHGQGLDFLAQHYFGHRMIPFTEVVGTGKGQKSFAQVAIDTATAYAAEDADFTFRLYETLTPKLVEASVRSVYEMLERPLIPIITKMEQAGIRVLPEKLSALSNEFAIKMDTLEREIIALAGMPFSVASPKQLGEVLFEKMQLSGGKKSAKSGAYTTDAETLEALAEEGHEIAAKVLEWRQFAKLKSTYTDALVEAIHPTDGRVHTSYGMALTTTGRLSSSNPNLQNIPIRTEEGRRIRSAFVAAEGCTLLSADYSQIELRLLAHMAEIPTLQAAFREGADIHAITASQMFGVAVGDVTSELRRRAKTINFGIIYGISAHGLAARLGISRQDAAAYIARYFEQYPGIRSYMDRTIATAREQGYVETLYGRRIYLKDIHSKNGALRQFSERAAINAPLQGTAADIIKRAMVAVDQLVASRQSSVVSEKALAIHDSRLTTPRLLLQVHDELILECPAHAAAALAPRIKTAMEGVAHLSIPLTVEVGIGTDWGQAH